MTGPRHNKMMKAEEVRKDRTVMALKFLKQEKDDDEDEDEVF